MKTIIAYTTRHGATEQVAERINDILGGKAEVYNLQNSRINPDNYDRVIIGASIHGGKIQRRMRRFLRRNKKKLLKKELGLFLCSIQTGEISVKQFNKNFSKSLRTHAKATALVGGAFYMDKMSNMEKSIVKKVAEVDKTVDNINYEEVEQFAQKFL
ncbi:MAG: flavodoxin domain-containing protein [Salinivirgaceae bacterium]